MTLDPIGPMLMTRKAGSVEGLNWYNYCNNNPVNYTDPSGLLTGAEGKKGGEYDADIAKKKAQSPDNYNGMASDALSYTTKDFLENGQWDKGRKKEEESQPDEYITPKKPTYGFEDIDVEGVIDYAMNYKKNTDEDMWQARAIELSTSLLVSLGDLDLVSVGVGITLVEFVNCTAGESFYGLYVFDVLTATGDSYTDSGSGVVSTGISFEAALTFGIFPQNTSHYDIFHSYGGIFVTDTISGPNGGVSLIGSQDWYGVSLGPSLGIGGGYAEITTNYTPLTFYQYDFQK